MDAYRERVLTEERDRLCDELQFAWMVGIEMAEASPEGKAERLCAALRVAAVSRNLKYWDASIGWGIQKQACNALKRLASESSVLRFQIARAILDIPALSRKPAHEYTIGSATLRVRENAYDEGAEGALCWAMELYAEMLQDPVQIHHQDDILEDLKVMLRYDTGHGVDHTGQLDVEMTAARVLQDFAAQDSQRMFEFGKEGLRGAWRDTIHWGIDMIAGSRHPDACALLGWVEFAPEFDDGTHEKARKARQSLVLGRVDL